MKTALVHDWLVGIGGAEKWLQTVFELFPSEIFTLVSSKKNLKNTFYENKKIISSFIQKLPFAETKYQNYLPLFPLAIEQLDLSGYDLILSSSHCVAKGVLTHAEQLHICHCHTPMRYAWDLYHQYLNETGLHRGLKGTIAKFFLHYLRNWDIHSVSRVDEFVANSKFVANRIKKIYGRDATVIYSQIDVNAFEVGHQKENFYLTASRMVPYKKIDLIVEAFTHMPDKRLVVIGDGPEMKKIKAKAANGQNKGKNIEILGYRSDRELKDYLKKAKAFVFAAVEDFGLIPVEAEASGTPVIALNKGGVRETVVDNQTGIFFPEQTVESIVAAVDKFEKKEHTFDPDVIRKQAEKFSQERFQKEFKEFVEIKYAEFKSGF